MQSFRDFSTFEEQFLKPLSEKRSIKVHTKSLNEMERWIINDQGALVGTHFEVVGQHIELHTDKANANSVPSIWDQPIYQQGSGTLILITDEEGSILIRAVFEPGNARRGYRNSGLILCTSCKFSQGNLAQQKAQGKIPPFSDLLDASSTQLLAVADAPGDGARANKQNKHHLCRVSREVIEETWKKLDEGTQENYALLSKKVFREAYLTRGIIGEHLRDLASLLLFV